MSCVSKCKSCDFGPCYICSPNAKYDTPYEENIVMEAETCPYFGRSETPEFITINAPSVQKNPFPSLMEWLSDEGYEKASPYLRDAILAMGDFEPASRWKEGAARAIPLLLELAHSSSWSEYQWNEWKNELKKINKADAVIGVWARAFQTGLMMAEYIRCELEKKGAERSNEESY